MQLYVNLYVLLNMIGIYKITNIVNNKVYVGSSKSINRRKYQHFYLLKNNKHKNLYLQFSYNKYGKSSFIFELLEKCDINQLSLKEEYWIKYYNSYKSKSGYNLALVENSTHSFNNETKFKMSKSNTSKKKLYQYDINGKLLNKFDSIKECSIKLNIPRRNIQNVLKVNNKTTHHFYFSYSNKFDYIKITPKLPSNTKSVIQYNLDNEIINTYISVKEASIKLNVAYTNMSRHLSQNKPKTIRGYVFKYKEPASPDNSLHN